MYFSMTKISIMKVVLTKLLELSYLKSNINSAETNIVNCTTNHFKLTIFLMHLS